MTTAKEAHVICGDLFGTQTKKQMLEHVGEWNTLMVWIEQKMREEKASHGTQASAEA